jgi:hypothetical protein
MLVAHDLVAHDASTKQGVQILYHSMLVAHDGVSNGLGAVP